MHACMPVWYPECWSVCILIYSLNRIGKVSIKNKVVGGCCLGVWVGHFFLFFFYWRLPFAIGSMVVLMAQVAKSTISSLLMKEGALAPLYFGH